MHEYERLTKKVNGVPHCRLEDTEKCVLHNKDCNMNCIYFRQIIKMLSVFEDIYCENTL